jgi:PRD1 phage membrane DNA delivery
VKIGESVITVLLAIVGVAIVAVLVSNNANTGSVLGSGGKAFAQALGCAVSPITGGSCGTNVTSSISY